MLACIGVALGCAGSARADLYIKIFETGFTPVEITAPSTNGGTTDIQLSDLTPAQLTALGNAAPDFTFNDFNGQSTLGSSQGELLGSADVTNSGNAGTLTIVVSETGFVSPPGPSYQMSNSAGYTSTIVSGATDMFVYQGFANSGSNMYGMGTPGTPPYVLNPIPFFNSDNSATTYTPFTSSSAGYTLTQTYTWVSNAGFVGDELLFHGSTIITASVPEPSSLVLLGLGSMGLIILRRHRTA
jgi:hypothetical protein